MTGTQWWPPLAAWCAMCGLEHDPLLLQCPPHRTEPFTGIINTGGAKVIEESQ
jgi:hypothetical protein